MITSLAIAADHPAYTGHFPGTPILPGVVLLDAVLHALASLEAGPGLQTESGVQPHWEIASAKFQSAVRPGDALTLEHTTLPNGSIRFVIRTGGQLIAQGTVRPGKAASPNGHQG